MAGGSNTVSVIAIDQAPTLTGTPAAGVVGQPYSHTFTVTGQPAPTVTVTTGTLPDGLDLSTDGVLSGTPTTTDSSTFTVTAANSVGTATLDVTLAVGDALDMEVHRYRHIYNAIRPHQALSNRTPSEAYRGRH
ncbi:putative Ig domain-containing protein [Rhodococcus hoagii]|nr:putative Ig domain-containing protein [Prescottella equi]